eukprot:m.137292 g.137292  ORF g.137292 m.137292 type:complete len:273 (-) comp11513_c0_seq1:58-876(-)
MFGWLFGNSKKQRKPYFGFGRYQGFFTPETVNLKDDPYFFDTSEHEWVAGLEEQWEVIRDELQEYLDKHDGSLIPYFGEHLMTSKKCWRALGLKFWNIYHPFTTKEFPKTMAIFEKIPGIVSVSFSQILPQSAIKPHYGDTNANFRCHLGLDIPEGLPNCGFTVGSETKPWENGKVLMFCDAHLHTAVNNTDKSRFILNFDVMRPEFAKMEASVCGTALAAIITQKVWLWFPFVKRSKLLTRIVYNMLIYFMAIPSRFNIGATTVYKILAAD